MGSCPGKGDRRAAHVDVNAVKIRAQVAILATLTLAVFANALGVVFLLDDLGDIADNPSAAAATFFDRLAYTNRPLTKASYALNDALHGLAPLGYAAVNVALHLAAVAFAYLLTRRAWRREGVMDAGSLALAATALWAVHPALSESVTYLSGRSMVLSAALMLGAMLAATADKPRPVVAFLCAVLAPLARETALILPFILVWWCWTVGTPSGRAWPVWLGAAVAALVIVLMPRHRDLIAFSFEMRDPLTALRDNLHAATQTLSFWFAPWRVTIFPAAPPPYGWTEIPTILRLCGFACVAALAVVTRRRAPVFAFGLGLALLALLPSQSVIWRADPVAVKPLYLAGLGLCLALTDIARRATTPRLVLALSLVVAVSLGVMTHQRNALFADPVALYADAVAKTPDNADALIAYGAALIGEGRYDEAEVALNRASVVQPDDERAMNLLAFIATIRGIVPSADAS